LQLGLAHLDLVPDESQTREGADAFYASAVLELLSLDGASLGGGAY